VANLIGEIPLAPASITAGTTYQLWQVIAPAYQRVVISGWFVGNDYNTNGTPGQLTLAFAGTAGSGGTAATPVAADQDCTETFQSSCETMLGTLATSLTTIRTEYINPQINVPQYLPLFEEIKLKGGGIFIVQFLPQVAGHVAGWLRIGE
jgi:hypothetical protein